MGREQLADRRQDALGVVELAAPRKHQRLQMLRGDGDGMVLFAADVLCLFRALPAQIPLAAHVVEHSLSVQGGSKFAAVVQRTADAYRLVPEFCQPARVAAAYVEHGEREQRTRAQGVGFGVGGENFFDPATSLAHQSMREPVAPHRHSEAKCGCRLLFH